MVLAFGTLLCTRPVFLSAVAEGQHTTVLHRIGVRVQPIFAPVGCTLLAACVPGPRRCNKTCRLRPYSSPSFPHFRPAPSRSLPLDPDRTEAELLHHARLKSRVRERVQPATEASTGLEIPDGDSPPVIVRVGGHASLEKRTGVPPTPTDRRDIEADRRHVGSTLGTHLTATSGLPTRLGGTRFPPHASHRTTAASRRSPLVPILVTSAFSRHSLREP